MKIIFASLASGSSGNCYYLGTGKYGILIDAGIGIRTIKKRLKGIGIPLDSIRAVFVTHDHSDHIKGVGHLGEGQHIPIYTTVRIHEGMNKSYGMTQKLYASVRHIEKEETMQLEDFYITPFDVPHDGTDNVGYHLEVEGITFSFLSDLGEITPTAARYIQKANYLIIEANYDEGMLETGAYPPLLKQRIIANTGHLSNTDTAGFLSENMTDTLRHIWLCHLSKNNNRPELAHKTVEDKLKEKGIILGRDVQLDVLERCAVSGPYEIDSDRREFAGIMEGTCFQFTLDM
ncbi:putative metallo-hydrolase YycJ [termite gut metagenome]|jgi:phosphoribosyl 1,2-cyclic phosphodiesterase|uniref:Putative metallo-hydrolase YycJ n=1 Tax=termite gut metagenome TaxID=433724 RepID=A0A5J4SHX2_9ZZZZ